MEVPKVAIVTTLKGTGATLQSWLEYHVSVGVHRFFLFFDDPEDPAIPFCDAYPQVRHPAGFSNKQVEKILSGSAWYKEQCQSSSLWESKGPFLAEEVQARQEINAEIGTASNH